MRKQVIAIGGFNTDMIDLKRILSCRAQDLGQVLMLEGDAGSLPPGPLYAPGFGPGFGSRLWFPPPLPVKQSCFFHAQLVVYCKRLNIRRLRPEDIPDPLHKSEPS